MIRKYILVLALLIPTVGCADCEAQDLIIPELAARINVVEASESDQFHKNLIKAAMVAQSNGDISRLDLLRLRIAMLSPAFRNHAKNLAVTQMYFYDGELPLTEQGTIDETAINWSVLIPFLIKIAPILLELLKILG
jgi:hypothetical protein